MSRFIGVISFDSITKFSEFQKIIMGLLDTGLKLRIEKDPKSEDIIPKYAGWQIIITSNDISGEM